MFNDDKFHNLIEAEEKESKHSAWEKVRTEYLTTDNVENIENRIATQPRKNRLDKKVEGGISIARRKATYVVAITGIALAIVLVIIFLVFYFNKDEDIKLNSGKESAYLFDCSLDDYERSKTDYTVKEYSESSGIELLYFDLYDEAVYCFDYTYKLKDSGEIFCYYENFFFEEFEYFIEVWIFEENAGVGFSESILNLSVETQVINNTEIDFVFYDSNFYANLNYAEYEYYIYIDCITSADSAFEIMEKLF